MITRRSALQFALSALAGLGEIAAARYPISAEFYEDVKFTVPENRLDPKSRRIELEYRRYRTTAASPGPPIVFLRDVPVGPHEHEGLGKLFGLIDALRAVADVVLLTQRGTGYYDEAPVNESDPEPAAYDLTRDGMTAWFSVKLQRCSVLARLRGVSLAGYNARQSAADIEDLRAALGVPKIQLLGEGYGSHVAMAALKYHPANIERVALVSLEGLDQAVKRSILVDRFFEYVAARVKADPKARADTPDFLALVHRVHDALDQSPLKLQLHPSRHEPDFVVNLKVDSFFVKHHVGGLMRTREGMSQLRTFYRNLEGMPTIALSDLRTQRNLYRRPIHLRDLAYLASGASAKRLAAIDKEAKLAVLGDAASFPLPQAQARTAGFDLGDEFRAPARFETSAMLVGGTMDFHTPYSEQREAGAQFTRATSLTVENGTHELLSEDSPVAAPLVRFFRGEKVASGTIRVPEIEIY